MTAKRSGTKVKILTKLPRNYMDRNDTTECPQCDVHLYIPRDGMDVICPRCKSRFYFGERCGF
jgi:hypothetical protein